MKNLGKLENGDRTHLWRAFSWHVGDKHANRICWLISFYAKFFPTVMKQLEYWEPKE